MGTDFRKHFESPDSVFDPTSGDRTGFAHPSGAAEIGAEDSAAVTFPMHWFVRLAYYGLAAMLFGMVARTAFYGDPQRDIWKVLVGCALVLGVLAFVPGSIRLDRRGIHQIYLMGLYEYSIPRDAILSYQQTTRAELRREGRLWFSRWGRQGLNRDGEHEQVVIVSSRHGRRYILHGMLHADQNRFVEELEKRGIPPHGYEGWRQYMADRGFPIGTGAP